MKSVNPMIMADFYKLSHRNLYPDKTQVIYSTWTPRASRIDGITEVVAFGFQAFIHKYLVEYFQEHFFDQSKESVVTDYVRTVKYTLGVATPETKHIEELHDLGYLPLKIKAVAEGTIVPLRTPMMTIENTHPKFFWLTNYIETLASQELWLPSTSATIAREYRKILDKYAMETVGNTDFVQFQGHDFSMRGMSSLESSMSSGAGHLLSFVGTDTIPAISFAEKYYGANIETELVGTSIPATEHSIQCTYGDDMEYIKNTITKVHPTGFVSMVSDGYDFWDVIGRVLPSLKSEIMARDGKLVIRPDSGDPVKIVTGDDSAPVGSLAYKGAVEALWDIFGGTMTDKGYKVLDSHIGLIYGDAITLARAEEISARLKAKGFASINCVYGIGSFTYQFNTRDTFGFALKSTLAVVDGDEKMIFKDPKTDNGIKKSQKGAVMVYKDLDKDAIMYKDGLMLKELGDVKDLLQVVFIDGVVTSNQKFSEIRKRVANG